MKRSWLWQGYFIFMAALTIGSLVFLFVYYPPTDRFELASELAILPLYFAQLVGLYGFVYFRRFGSRISWKALFVATVVETVWMLYPDFGGLFLAYDLVLFLVMLVSSLVFLPLLVGLYSYAFRNSAPWLNATLQQ